VGKFFLEESRKEYFKKIEIFLEKCYCDNVEIFPKKENIFTAFSLTTFVNVKVVILGQDPYHDNNQAHGLAFSVLKNCKVPPSLKNIYKEIQSDIECSIPQSGDLTSWAEEGVLLLNTILTVQAHKASSHKDIGWEEFTNAVISKLSTEKENIVFVLWGKYAQSKSDLIDETKHLILMSHHPSPLSAYRGFFGSKPFSKINNYLNHHDKSSINWCLEKTLF
jgi:uracil-DNA glycosylase